MTHRPLARVVGMALTALLAAFAAASGPAAAAGPEIAAKGALRGPERHLAKVSRHLLRAHRMSARGAPASRIRAELPAVRLRDGLLEIDIRLRELTPSTVGRLEALGVRVTAVSYRWARVAGLAAPEVLEEIAVLPQVTTIHPRYRPRTRAGSVTSQGDASIHADDARLDFAVDGSGVEVGVLTDSFYATANVSGTVTAPLAVTKTAAPPSVTKPSGMVTFTVRVDNLAGGMVEINSLTDDVHGNLNGQGSCAVTRFIPAGESYSCSYTAAVAGSAGSAETSTVTASGLDDVFSPMAGSDTVTVPVKTAGVAGCDRVVTDTHPQGSSDLPAEVTILDNCDNDPVECVGLRDEGAAMAELVHDLAPGAEILFHTAFKGEADFADGIAELVACGADVLVDDVIYLGEPMFQDGPIAQAAQAAVDGGVSYFSAAGNEGDRGVDEVYLDADPSSNDPPPPDDAVYPTDGSDLHDFDPGAGDNRFAAITLPQGCGVDLVLQWNDPYSGTLGPGASRDLDLYLCSTDSLNLNSVPPEEGGPNLDGCDFAGAEKNLALADDTQSCGGADPPFGDPIEVLSYFNNKGFPVTGYLAVEHYCGGKADSGSGSSSSRWAVAWTN